MNNKNQIYSVSEITGAIKHTLESQFGRVRVRGEIGNFRQPSSGHLYFALKDDQAQLRAVMFRGNAVGLRFLPADGLEVEVEGEITVYEPRGDVQILVREMVPAGVGALMQAFENLKRRLGQEGLFDPERKQTLPPFPEVIGIVTSPSGAAIRDLVHVLTRRWPVAEIVFHPSAVQGDGAAASIADALTRMDRWGGADVLIVGRGGGSLEDLWAFNEEPVARAIAGCRTPVVSAVGHETDITIADLVADVRAATPSAAAELVSPDQEDVVLRIRRSAGRLSRRVWTTIETQRSHLNRLVGAYGFRRPEQFLERKANRLEHFRGRLRALGSRLVQERRSWSVDLDRRLGHHHPRGRMAAARAEVGTARARFENAAHSSVSRKRAEVDSLGSALRVMDPRGVLGRGYSVAREAETGRVLTAASQTSPGASLVVQFHRDRIRGRVERIEPGGLEELEDNKGEGS